MFEEIGGRQKREGKFKGQIVMANCGVIFDMWHIAWSISGGRVVIVANHEKGRTIFAFVAARIFLITVKA